MKTVILYTQFLTNFYDIWDISVAFFYHIQRLISNFLSIMSISVRYYRNLDYSKQFQWTQELNRDVYIAAVKEHGRIRERDI